MFYLLYSAQAVRSILAPPVRTLSLAVGSCRTLVVNVLLVCLLILSVMFVIWFMYGLLLLLFRSCRTPSTMHRTPGIASAMLGHGI